MIDKICMFLTNKIRKEMPEIDDERAEVTDMHIIQDILIVLLAGYMTIDQNGPVVMSWFSVKLVRLVRNK